MASNQSKSFSPRDSTDPFDSLLTLEDTLYTTAYTSGVTDGARAGRIEGRVFGLENGFEKFAALGALHGRSVVWGARALPSSLPPKSIPHRETEEKVKADGSEKTIPILPPTSRLINNITLLHSLTDPDTFSTQNTEDGVADFDDRVKRAGAKAKVIERIVGETDGVEEKREADGEPARGKRNVRLEGERKGKKGDGSMEDFEGSRLLR